MHNLYSLLMYKVKTVPILALFFMPFVFVAQTAMAAAPVVPTDAGRELQYSRELKQPALQNSAPAPLQAPVAKPNSSNANSDVRVKVDTFTFSGNSVMTEAQLQAMVAPWSGRELNFGELEQVTKHIEQTYRMAGYFLAQAILPTQQIRNGSININISEGRIGKIRLEGESRVSAKAMYLRLDKLLKTPTMTEAKLERQILLINDLAGGTSSIDLQAGDENGTTDVVLMEKPSKLFTGRAGLDNDGLPATGEYRLGLYGALVSPLHLGDRLAGNFVVSNTGKLHTYGLRYDLPIGGDGWQVFAAKTRANYTLGGNFTALNASGTADSWQTGVTYPWLRSRDANLFLELSADYNRLSDNLAAIPLNLDKRSYALSFSPYGNWRDKWLGGASNEVGLELRTGKLRLGNDAKALDLPPAGADTEGNFSKLIVNLQRQQFIAKNLTITGQWKQQFASTNLDSSEKLTVGGAHVMVGYPVGQAASDEGAIGKLALEWHAASNLDFALFAEYAHLDILKNPIAGNVNNANLRDVGLSANWRLLNGIDFASSIAWAGSDDPIPTDNNTPRIWANLGYNW